MSNINLLPWREELRELNQKVFLSILGGCVVAAVIIIFIIDISINESTNAQNDRNKYLNTNILKLDEKIKSINDFKKRRTTLLDRIEVINGLQGNRPTIVKVFDQLTKMLPDGVYFEKLQLKGDQFSLTGIAESNNRVAALMRKISTSELFASPNLTAVKKKTLNGNLLNEFNLSFILVSNNNEE